MHSSSREAANELEPLDVKSNRFAVFAWIVTALTLGVILWGAYVRASHSGDGCGAHWPLCNGTVALPQRSETKTLVELAHRATSGLDGLLVVALVIWAFRKYRRGHAVRKASTLTAVFFITEALIGAGLVLLGLVANNASLWRAFYLSIHLVNTFILVAGLALTAWWATVGESVHTRLRDFLRGKVGVAILSALALGVSGAIAALGATLFPEIARAEISPAEMSPASQLLFSLRQYKLHPLLALLVGAYLVYFAVAMSKVGGRSLGAALGACRRGVDCLADGGRAFECGVARADRVADSSPVSGRLALARANFIVGVLPCAQGSSSR